MLNETFSLRLIGETAERINRIYEIWGDEPDMPEAALIELNDLRERLDSDRKTFITRYGYEPTS